MDNIDKLQRITITPDTLLIEALKLMDKLDKKLLIVMEDRTFSGLLSIVDIQRAIIRNINLDSEVKKILREDIRIAGTENSFEEIKEMMLAYRTECMPVLNDHNEIVAIYFWEDVFGEISISNNPIRIPLVIMAGGKGKRLKPFSNIIPKALFHYGEKTILEEIIYRFHNHKISEVFISVNHKADLIKNYLEEELLPTFRQLTFKDTFDFLSRPWPGKENYTALPYTCSGLLYSRD